LALLCTLRPSGVTGDSNDATSVSYALTLTDLFEKTIILDDGTPPAESEPLGVISHVVVAGRVAMPRDPVILATCALRIASPLGNTLCFSEAAAPFGETLEDYTSVDILVAPDGSPWTWNAINGITALQAYAAITRPSTNQELTLELAEIRLEVYGALGGEPHFVGVGAVFGSGAFGVDSALGEQGVMFGPETVGVDSSIGERAVLFGMDPADVPSALLAVDLAFKSSVTKEVEA
jgi:hypothetical protein